MKLDKVVTVIDDFIDKEYQEEIKNILVGNNPFIWEGEEVQFDWYFISDVTDAFSDRQQKRCALTHEYAGLDWQEDEDDEFNNSATQECCSTNPPLLSLFPGWQPWLWVQMS